MRVHDFNFLSAFIDYIYRMFVVLACKHAEHMHTYIYKIALQFKMRIPSLGYCIKLANQNYMILPPSRMSLGVGSNWNNSLK